MDHDAFMYTFIKMIKSAMVADENNEFAHTSLLFCAKFVGSFEGDETHPLLARTCEWLLTVSLVFVCLVLQKAGIMFF